MTYRDLQKLLNALEKTLLDQEVIVYMEADEVFYAVTETALFPVENEESTQLCLTIV